MVSVVIIRTVVVLPAPLGPSIPSTVPRGTLKLTPSTATVSPKCLTSCSASMAGPRASLLPTVLRARGGGHLSSSPCCRLSRMVW